MIEDWTERDEYLDRVEEVESVQVDRFLPSEVGVVVDDDCETSNVLMFDFELIPTLLSSRILFILYQIDRKVDGERKSKSQNRPIAFLRPRQIFPYTSKLSQKTKRMRLVLGKMKDGKASK